MHAHSPITAFLAILVFQAAGVRTAGSQEIQSFSRGVGGLIDISLERFHDPNTTYFVRTPAQLVALWSPRTSLDVFNQHYFGRVVVFEKNNTLQIRNLTVQDGDTYEVAMRISSAPEEIAVTNFMLFVFNVTSSVNLWANKSCTLDLSCEAGAGTKSKVRYTWKPTMTGYPTKVGPWLHLALQPKEKDLSYTCSAQAGDKQGFWNVFPYRFCSTSSAASGRFVSGSWLCYCVALAVLIAFSPATTLTLL